MSLQRWIAIALVAGAVISTTVSAQQRRTAEQQVLATDDQRMDALRRGDPVPLEKIYADDYTLVTGTGQIRTKADQLAELKTGELKYRQIEAVERQVRMYGDVAIVLTKQRATIVQGGQQITGGDERVTRVYKNYGGQWRVIATHATPIR
jgi:uncharacterized protein (TIGR02246 family)